MALTALEQLKLVNGEDGARPEATDLRTLVKASAFIYASNFYSIYKEFDTGANPEAASYLNKMFALCRAVVRGQSDESLFRIIITIIGNLPIDFSTVVAATDTQWETFLADQIDEAMEILADIRKDEIIAYDALP